jgi:hypothetical protein
MIGHLSLKPTSARLSADAGSKPKPVQFQSDHYDGLTAGAASLPAADSGFTADAASFPALPIAPNKILTPTPEFRIAAHIFKAADSIGLKSHTIGAELVPEPVSPAIFKRSVANFFRRGGTCDAIHPTIGDVGATCGSASQHGCC